MKPNDALSIKNFFVVKPLSLWYIVAGEKIILEVNYV